MKYIAVRHDLTAFEPSKKARSPPGRIAATRLYYTVQIKQIMCLFGCLVQSFQNEQRKNNTGQQNYDTD